MQVLVKMRPEGHDIQEELMDIQRNAKETSGESFWASVAMLYSRGHYKQAMAALLIPFFQQFTGMNAIMFYGAPTSCVRLPLPCCLPVSIFLGAAQVFAWSLLRVL